MCGHRKYKASFGEKIWKHIYTENTMEGQDLPGVNMASVRWRLGLVKTCMYVVAFTESCNGVFILTWGLFLLPFYFSVTHPGGTGKFGTN